MTIRTKEQLTQDFEVLARDNVPHRAFAASERIRQHLAAIPTALSAPLTTDEVPYCHCPGECTQDVDKDPVCPVVAKVYADLLPVLLKRIGVES